MALLVVISAVSLATAPVQAQTASSGFCYTFTRNLGVGRTLNTQDAQALTTVLTNAGLWTSGTSITTFDDSVASAVSGFQQKYAAQILTPNGLSYGTGYVGAATRAQLNSMFGCSSSSTSTTFPTQNIGVSYNNGQQQSSPCPAGYTCSPISTAPVAPVCPTGYTCSPVTTQNPSAPTLSSVSPTSATQGSSITVYGSGFSSPSTVITFNGNGKSQQVSPASISSGGTVITATVPSDLGVGTYSITVANVSYGWTASSVNSISFTIINQPTSVCPAGYTCSQTPIITTPIVATPVTSVCPSGYTCNQVTTSPTATCPAGYTCNPTPGTAQLGNCPAGYTCTIGNWTVSNASQQTTCPAGYTCTSTPGTPQNGNCPAGYTCSVPVTTCPAGYTCNPTPGTAQLGNCPAGYTCNQIPVITIPSSPCPAGFTCSPAEH